MENAPAQQQSQETAPQSLPTSQPPVVQPKNSKLLIILITTLILLVLSSGGYYMLSKTKPVQQTIVTTPTPTPANMDEGGTPSPTSAISDSWDSYTTTRLPGNALPTYTISYPPDWTREVKTEENILSTLTLSKEGYQIKITQGPFDGAFCVFSGEMPEGPAVDYRGTKYTEIKSNSMILRRIQQGTSQNSINISFCSASPQSATTFGSLTPIGDLSYTIPKNFTETMLVEMDSIVKTITPITSTTPTP